MTVPLSSGPRCARDRVARSSTSAGTGALRLMMPKIPHIRSVAPSGLRQSSFILREAFELRSAQTRTRNLSSSQCTLRNEYTPEGMLAPEAVGLQKCSVRVSGALA